MKYITLIVLTVLIASCGADPFKEKTLSPNSASLSSSSTTASGSSSNESSCICTMDYTPVCGVDGKTYSNACSANCAGMKEHSLGECHITN